MHISWLTEALGQCFSTAGPRPGTGPSSYKKRIYRAAVSHVGWEPLHLRAYVNFLSGCLIFLVLHVQFVGSHDSLVGIATNLRARPRVRFPSGAGYFSLLYNVNIGSGAHPTYLMGTADTLTGVKRQGHEADYSSPSTADVKNTWSYTSTEQISRFATRLRDGQLGFDSRQRQDTFSSPQRSDRLCSPPNLLSTG
jgi:hypothetical protein